MVGVVANVVGDVLVFVFGVGLQQGLGGFGLGGGYGVADEFCSCMIWRMFCTPVCRCLTMAVAVAVASRRINASTMATCSCSVTW